MSVHAEVVVKGANKALKNNLQAHFANVKIVDNSRASQRKFTRIAKQASEAVGYYSSDFEFTLKEQNLEIKVQPGPRVLWQNPDLQFNGATPSQELTPREIDCKPGSGLDHRCYEQLKRNWLNQVQFAGYLDAKYQTSELKVNVETLQAHGVLHLLSGPLYRLEGIEFTGSVLNQELLQRLSPIAADEPIRETKVLQLRRNLENSRYFSSIAIKTEKTGTDKAILKVELADAARYSINLGLGYGTDTEVRTKIRLDTPRLNAAGHRLSNELQLSKPFQKLSSSYQIPLDRPLEKTLDFTASLEREKLDDTENTIAGFSTFINDLWWQNWQIRYGASLLYEEEKVGKTSTNSTLYALPLVSFSRTLLEDTIDPNSGSSLQLTVSGSDETLGADTPFLRVLAGYKYLLPLGGSHRLLARVEAGVVATTEIENVPLSQRFLTGGDQSVRGYSYNSLGKRNANGDIEGGKYLNVASLEYSFRILPSWRLALFTDAGRAYDDTSVPWNLGVGVGVRWISPIGQIKVDLATPVNNDEESGLQIHISMGSVL